MWMYEWSSWKGTWKMMPDEAITLLQTTRGDGEASCKLVVEGVVICFNLQQMTQSSYEDSWGSSYCATRRIQRFTEHLE